MERFDTNSDLFSATFCEGAVQRVVLTNQVSTVNLIPPIVFRNELMPNLGLKTRRLQRPLVYSSVAKGASVKCHQSFTADTGLCIRHGIKLILQAMEWFYGDNSYDLSIIGRTMLGSV